MFQCVWTQNLVEINGQILADDDLEGIHIINKSAEKFTITDGQGRFLISARQNDTILISALAYKPIEIIVDALTYNSKSLKVYLEEKINVLDEVIVGKILTGNLWSDIENSDAKRSLDFYDLGIPGNTRLPLTQAERKYKDASEGNIFQGLSINVHKLLNVISGRTKRLKKYLQLEQSNNCLEMVVSEYAKALLGDLNWENERMADYFFYVSDDPKFLQFCHDYQSISMYQFLESKLESYKDNLNEK
ncbi:carboxypeptidase-like regulatory domain-containing protein [Aegicerativicinus sediminis]|uniref:carboxypeptidase-like regulatory domain-containing protein n=1 Tax=Aegicerativicinus sediminis TaxID=2893202 RepID=UPI001E47961E|nr:carboxypeptidase-like regulatory domain-containing protein [Aegicerativicinus sediminis]